MSQRKVWPGLIKKLLQAARATCVLEICQGLPDPQGPTSSLEHGLISWEVFPGAPGLQVYGGTCQPCHPDSDSASPDSTGHYVLAEL